jgi:hypothetical protein
MFQPVSAKPDLVAQEHELLARWRDRRTFARLRAQNAGGPRWSFLDGPITANNPMGVHHAWGRTYKDVFCRYHAMLGDGRALAERLRLPGACGSRSTSSATWASRASATSRRTASPSSSRSASSAVLTYAARHDRAVGAARDMDGLDDPDELRRLRDLLARTPPRSLTIQGPDGPADRHREMLVGRTGATEGRRRQLLHVQQREQRPDLGLPRRVPQAGLDLQGPRLDALVPALRDGPVQMEMNEGYRDREDRAHGPVPARRPARRVAARLDDDAVDARRERRRGSPPRPALRPDPAGR